MNLHDVQSHPNFKTNKKTHSQNTKRTRGKHFKYRMAGHRSIADRKKKYTRYCICFGATIQTAYLFDNVEFVKESLAVTQSNCTKEFGKESIVTSHILHRLLERDSDHIAHKKILQILQCPNSASSTIITIRKLHPKHDFMQQLRFGLASAATTRREAFAEWQNVSEFNVYVVSCAIPFNDPTLHMAVPSEFQHVFTNLASNEETSFSKFKWNNTCLWYIDCQMSLLRYWKKSRILIVKCVSHATQTQETQ